MSWMRCFEAAARLSSFTQAARELCVTQGAVSQQVRKLEERLGVLLFRRLPRQLVLTPVGMELHAAVKAGFDGLENALAVMECRTPQRSLALSCPPSFAVLWLIPRVGPFYKLFPQIELRVSADLHTPEMQSMLAEDFHAAICYDVDQSAPLESTLLLDEYLCPVASPDFLRRCPHLQRPSDLTASMLLHDETSWRAAEPGTEWRLWLDEAGLRGTNLTQGRTFNMAHLAVQAALDGQGIAMGRMALVHDHIVSGKLIPLFDRTIRSPAAYRLMHLPNPYQPARQLGEWLKQECDRFRDVRDTFMAHAPRWPQFRLAAMEPTPAYSASRMAAVFA